MFLALCLLSSTAFAQGKELEKQRKKEYKAKMKEYKKKGVEVTGTSRSLDVALLTFYDKLNSGDYKELVVNVEGCPTLNLCDQQSLAAASAKYATLANQFVRGRINQEMGNDATTNKGAVDKFYSAYESLVSTKVSGVLSKSFAVKKKTKDGNYEYEAYYLLDENVAQKKRTEAAREALEKTELNQEWGNKISNFVSEGFDTNK